MEKKKKRKKFKLIHGIFLFVFLYITLIYYNQHKLLKELEAKRDKNILEVEKINTEIRELEAQIENSDSLEFVEKIAREELGMVKPREIIYIDKNKKSKSSFNR